MLAGFNQLKASEIYANLLYRWFESACHGILSVALDMGAGEVAFRDGITVTNIALASIWQNITASFATLPPFAGYLLALLGLCLAVAVIGEIFQRRAMMQHLQMLSEATDEQSRLIERMRRSLSDIMEIVVTIEHASRHRVRVEQAAPLPTAETNPDATPAANTNTNSNVLAASLRQELESLRAEFGAELAGAPPRE